MRKTPTGFYLHCEVSGDYLGCIENCDQAGVLMFFPSDRELDQTTLRQISTLMEKMDADRFGDKQHHEELNS